MSHWFTPALQKIMDGTLDLDTHDIRAAILMTNNTALASRAALTIAAITTLDEMGGANYVRKALTTKAVNRTDASNRAEFDADDVLWTALGNGLRSMAGILIFRFITTDADHVPIAFLDGGAFPLNPGGADFRVIWNAAGILQVTAT